MKIYFFFREKRSLIVMFCLLTTASANQEEVFQPSPEENVNATSPFLIEGDIIISPRDMGRWGIRQKYWPNGVVPYEFSSKFAASSNAVWAANAGMTEWSLTTCIQFKKRTKERNYLYFHIGDLSETFCLTQHGNILWYEGLLISTGHAIGFAHEHSHPDRDDYVTIVKENIKEGKSHNFRKVRKSQMNSLGFKYDYDSVMHYGPKYFSKNGYATIVPKNAEEGANIGQRNGVSITDIKRIRKLYKCKDQAFLEYGSGCKWRTSKAAHRCWRYCDPNTPKSGKWCWINKSCGSGFLGLAKGFCPGSALFMPCASSCGE